jgi:hypothetical protein
MCRVRIVKTHLNDPVFELQMNLRVIFALINHTTTHQITPPVPIGLVAMLPGTDARTLRPSVNYWRVLQNREAAASSETNSGAAARTRRYLRYSVITIHLYS